MVENLSTGDVITIEYSGSPVVDITSAGLDIISNSIAPIFTYNLKRVAYDSITG
jgi:D-mannonate dehydratase